MYMLYTCVYIFLKKKHVRVAPKSLNLEPEDGPPDLAFCRPSGDFQVTHITFGGFCCWAFLNRLLQLSTFCVLISRSYSNKYHFGIWKTCQCQSVSMHLSLPVKFEDQLEKHRKTGSPSLVLFWHHLWDSVGLCWRPRLQVVPPHVRSGRSHPPW